MNRGSALDQAAGGYQPLLASMRPRFMNRGSCVIPMTSAASLTGFNEAPIHESGKFQDSRPRAHRSGRFNEAPIHESGKFCWQRDTTQAHWQLQ